MSISADGVFNDWKPLTMSEPTPAQEAYAADMALDAQIDAWYDAHHQPVNRPDPDWLNNSAIFDVIKAHLGGDDETPEKVIRALGLTRQQRGVMGQDEDGTLNGQDYIEARWVSQWERIAALPLDDPVKRMREMLGQ